MYRGLSLPMKKNLAQTKTHPKVKFIKKLEYKKLNNISTILKVEKHLFMFFSK